MGVEIIGPVVQEPRFDLAVDGVVVPHVHGVPAEKDGELYLEVRRVLFGPWTREEVLALAPLLARAMAVSAGYTHHGPESRPDNPHAFPRVGRMPLRRVLRAVDAPEVVGDGE